jgi:pSer/pThr/pTyr-binding forkhead associated (FHA) protein
LVDANSSNGTFVGDTRVTVQPARLADGQEVRFGAAKFVFRETPIAPIQEEERRTLPPRKQSALSLRTASAFLLVAFVVGFAVTQYLSYLNYKRANEHAISGHPAGRSP